METTLPLAALDRKKHFSPAVQIPVPFRVLVVLKMIPGIFLENFKPYREFFISRKAEALGAGHKAFKMNPPELLIRFQLQGRLAFAIKNKRDWDRPRKTESSGVSQQTVPWTTFFSSQTS
jgi:hypothetical protein